MKDVKEIKVYTKRYCPFCVYLKEYLKKNGHDFEEISVDGRSDFYKQLKATTGHHTVPQVFIDSQFIGGSEDTIAYLRDH